MNFYFLNSKLIVSYSATVRYCTIPLRRIWLALAFSLTLYARRWTRVNVMELWEVFQWNNYWVHVVYESNNVLTAAITVCDSEYIFGCFIFCRGRKENDFHIRKQWLYSNKNWCCVLSVFQHNIIRINWINRNIDQYRYIYIYLHCHIYIWIQCQLDFSGHFFGLTNQRNLVLCALCAYWKIFVCLTARRLFDCWAVY